MSTTTSSPTGSPTPGRTQAVTLTADGVPAAPTGQDQHPFALARHSLILAGRAVTKIRRTPEQLIDVTLQPILFTVVFVYLFGGAISGSTHDYLQYVLPGLLTQTLLFSSVAIGVNLNTDVEKGVFDRFRSLPIPRSAPLVGAVLGDVVRFVTSIVVMIGFGYIIGFRIETDPFQALAACLLALGFALAMSWLSVTLGLVLRNSGSVQGIGFMALFPLTFGSSMFVSADTLPGWLQAWVKINPVTHLTDAIRGLLIGGLDTSDLVSSIAWGIGLVVVFAPLAVRAYRRRT
ncbi:ABC transporter permease [Spongisporangium articulatum]|uniref:Transport permease protein n=1 Tax=Spongisporangium articulatum TaxID=3362603 RepID=A0ABW8AIQ6_9ACTN